MTNLLIAIGALPVQIRSSIRQWFRKHLAQRAAILIEWMFSFKEVQHAFVDTISCNSPIGRALNGHIEDYSGEMDVDNIQGLDRYVENSIDDYLSNNEIEADNIKHLDRYVAEAVTAEIDDMNDSQIARLVAQRISY
jgi:hypothetical protein